MNCPGTSSLCPALQCGEWGEGRRSRARARAPQEDSTSSTPSKEGGSRRWGPGILGRAGSAEGEVLGEDTPVRPNLFLSSPVPGWRKGRDFPNRARTRQRFQGVPTCLLGLFLLTILFQPPHLCSSETSCQASHPCLLSGANCH